MQVIVFAVIALIVLVVLVVVFNNQISIVVKGFTKTREDTVTCFSLLGDPKCVKGDDCPLDWKEEEEGAKCEIDYVCCERVKKDDTKTVEKKTTK